MSETLESMKETPRTNQFAHALLSGPAQTARHRSEIEWQTFSRALERELVLALRELERFRQQEQMERAVYGPDYTGAAPAPDMHGYSELKLTSAPWPLESLTTHNPAPNAAAPAVSNSVEITLSSMPAPAESGDALDAEIHRLAVNAVCPIRQEPTTVFEVNMVKTLEEFGRSVAALKSDKGRG